MKIKLLLTLAGIAALLIFISPTPSSAAESFSFTRNLTIGSTGEDVRVLQRFLNANGFTIASSGPGSSGNESTYFGPATASALSRYQSSVGISPALGHFGPATRSRISSSSGGSGGVTPSTVSPANTIVITPPEFTTQQQSNSLTIETTLNQSQITWNTVSHTFSPYAANFIIKNNISTDVNISEFSLAMSGSSVTATSTVSFKLLLIDSNNISITLPETYTLTDWSSRRISFNPVTIPAGRSVLFSLIDVRTTLALYSGTLNIQIPALSIISNTGAALGPSTATPITRSPIQVIAPTPNPNLILEISEYPIRTEPTNLVAGSANKLIGAINLQVIGTNNVEIDGQIVVGVNDSNRNNSITNLRLYKNNISYNSILGAGVPTGGYTTITFNSFTIPANTSVTLFIAGDLSPVGTDQPGRVGATISLSLPAGAITGVSGNNRVSAPTAPLSLNRTVTIIAPRTTTETPSNNTISGRVIDESGAGVGSVSVSLNGQQTITTDSNGSFSFTPSFLGYPAGTIYSLSATLPSGYISASAINARVAGNTYINQVFGLDCNANQNQCADAIVPFRSLISDVSTHDLPTDTGFTFRLIRRATLPITVTVIDNQRNPLSNIKVLVSRNEIGRTDNNGQLTIDAAAAPLSFRRGALYLISIEPPSGYFVIASDARVRAQKFNWQALGVDCRARGSVCLDALRRLFINDPLLESYINNAAANDFAEDNFTFIVAPVATPSTPITNSGTSTGNTDGTTTGGSGTDIGTNTNITSTTTPTIILPDITGRVTNDAGEGVSGATIVVNNITRATTGADGAFTILGSALRFRKGALFQISVASVPLAFDSIRATRSRISGARAYNWQALGVDCTVRSQDCLSALNSLKLDLETNINSAATYDLPDDNFTFMIVRTAVSSAASGGSTSSTGLTETTSTSSVTPRTYSTPTFYDIAGRVTDSRGTGVAEVVVHLNDKVKTTTTNADGFFRFAGSDIRFPRGASYSLVVDVPSIYGGSQALSGGFGSTVIGATYQWQILNFDCRGSSDAICVGDSPTKDFSTDSNFHFILKDRASSSVNTSLNTASALTQLGRILFFWR